MIAQNKAKPGKGWRHIDGMVYEHASGVRIHLNGLVRLPNKDMHRPDQEKLDLIIKINGGNKKRGLMAYSLTNIYGNVEL